MAERPKSCASETILAWASSPPSSIYCNKSVIQKPLVFIFYCVSLLLPLSFLLKIPFEKFQLYLKLRKRGILFYFIFVIQLDS